MVQHSLQQCSRALQVSLRRASLRDTGRRSEQIDERHQGRAIRQCLLRLMKMKSNLCAHQARFAIATVDLENFTEHSLGRCEFVLVLQELCATQSDCRIAGIACALHELLCITVVALIAAAGARGDQRIDIADRGIGILRRRETCGAQLRKLRLRR
jgi:hypothetical protein